MKLIEHFFEILAPNACLVCEKEGSHLCLWCREEALPELASRCYKCNKLSDFGRVCPACRSKSPLKHVFIKTEYSDVAKELVYKMKFSYSGEAADLIAEEMMNTLPSLPADTLVVHIPTITSHVRSRGFDHARRIAKALASGAGLEHATALARLGQHRQVGSDRSTRLMGVADSFRVNERLLEGCPVLLVDDVLTTGATIEAAARMLKQAGAKSVNAVIFARAR